MGTKSDGAREFCAVENMTDPGTPEGVKPRLRKRNVTPLTPQQRIDSMRRIVANHQYEKLEGALIDASSASVYVRVYDRCTPENQAKLTALPLAKGVKVCWASVK